MESRLGIAPAPENTGLLSKKAVQNEAIGRFTHAVDGLRARILVTGDSGKSKSRGNETTRVGAGHAGRCLNDAGLQCQKIGIAAGEQGTSVISFPSMTSPICVLEVSTWSAELSTSTVSVLLPDLQGASITNAAFTSKTAPSCLIGFKAGSAALECCICPGAGTGMNNSPGRWWICVTATEVSTLVAVTVAPAMAAPLASVTVPEMLAVTPAYTRVPNSTANANSNTPTKLRSLVACMIILRVNSSDSNPIKAFRPPVIGGAPFRTERSPASRANLTGYHVARVIVQRCRFVKKFPGNPALARGRSDSQTV